MAKESVKAREVKRVKMVKRFAVKRAALKAAGDYQALSRLPKNSSKVRLHNRNPECRDISASSRIMN